MEQFEKSTKDKPLVIKKRNELIQKASYDYNNTQLNIMNYLCILMQENLELEFGDEELEKIENLEPGESIRLEFWASNCIKSYYDGKLGGLQIKSFENALTGMTDVESFKIKLGKKAKHITRFVLSWGKTDIGKIYVNIDGLLAKIILLPKILNQKGNYTTLNLYYWSLIDGSKCKRLYEILISHYNKRKDIISNNTNNENPEIKITLMNDEIVEQLKLKNTPTYSSPSQIKRNIIIPTKEQMNEKTLYHCRFNEIKEGRSILGYDFYIQQIIDVIINDCDEAIDEKNENLIIPAENEEPFHF